MSMNDKAVELVQEAQPMISALRTIVSEMRDVPDATIPNAALPVCDEWLAKAKELLSGKEEQ